MSARRLIVPRGTFALRAAELSSQIETCYVFEKSDVRTMLAIGTRVVKGVDQRGSYKKAALSDNWTASAEQCAMMLNYPKDALAFRDVSKVKRHKGAKSHEDPG